MTIDPRLPIAEQSGSARFPGASATVGPAAIVCFSHLRWSFVWQRPQHLLTRLAQSTPVYVVEEPEFVDGVPAPMLRVDLSGPITRLTPCLPASPHLGWGFNPQSNPIIRQLLTPFFRDHGWLGGGSANVVAWYYTPMALGAEPERFDRPVVVYDVMDELANFRGAPAALRDQERTLMARADLVFTGGPSLYDARQGRHPRLHCFPSGVEADHFGQARDIVAVPREIADIDGPLLGFYGVIDERLDIDLVGQLADLRPDWTLVMIGPIVKIAPQDLPQRPNIRYLGGRDYSQLPAYLARFDAAILPFARNEATRFISPTKTLEYMAGGKPVVSTPITDVVGLYGDVVEFGYDAPSFVQAIERLWAETPAERAVRAARSAELLAEHDWDAIAARMQVLIEQASRRHALSIRAGVAAASALPLPGSYIGASTSSLVAAKG